MKTKRLDTHESFHCIKVYPRDGMGKKTIALELTRAQSLDLGHELTAFADTLKESRKVRVTAFRKSLKDGTVHGTLVSPVATSRRRGVDEESRIGRGRLTMSADHGRKGGRTMTTAEALEIYDALHKAFESVNPQEEIQARNALMQAHAISWNEGVAIGSAFAAFRSVFQKLNDWKMRHPPN